FFGMRRRHDNPGALILNQFAKAANAACDYRERARHGFQSGYTEPFLQRRHREDVRRPQKFARIVDSAEQLDPLSASEFCDFAFEFSANRSVTRDEAFQPDGRCCQRELRDGFDEIAMALARLERANRRYRELAIGYSERDPCVDAFRRSGRAEAVAIHTAMNNRDAL